MAGAVITGYYANLITSIKMIMARRTQSPICGNQWLPPQLSNTQIWKNHGQLFRTIETHQCGVLMDDASWLAASIFTTSDYCHLLLMAHTGYSVKTPYLPILSTQSLLASTCFCWNHKCFSWAGYRSIIEAGLLDCCECHMHLWKCSQ